MQFTPAFPTLLSTPAFPLLHKEKEERKKRKDRKEKSKKYACLGPGPVIAPGTFISNTLSG